MTQFEIVIHYSNGDKEKIKLTETEKYKRLDVLNWFNNKHVKIPSLIQDGKDIFYNLDNIRKLEVNE